MTLNLLNSAVKLSVSIFLFYFVMPVNGQDKIDTAIEKLASHPKERIYLAYSKSKYVAGETIRFKAFVFSGARLSPVAPKLFVYI